MTEFPGYVAGTWTIDPVHSEIGFSVRHMAVSKVKGRFDKFEGSFVTAADPAASTVTVTVDAASINTYNEQRDGHMRSADFFEVETHPTWSFSSTGIKDEGGELTLLGDLTIKGVTKPVVFSLEVVGIGPDAYGGTRAGFSAKAEINRNDFGVSFNGPIPGVAGGLIVSDKVSIPLEIEGVLQEG